MFVCKEQQNPIIFMERQVRISDKAANGHYKLCNLPITEGTIGMYLSVYSDGDIESVLGTLSDEELTKIVENGVKEEIIDISDIETWNSIPE